MGYENLYHYIEDGTLDLSLGSLSSLSPMLSGLRYTGLQHVPRLCSDELENPQLFGPSLRNSSSRVG